MLRSTIFNIAFYTITATFLILGSPMLLAPRKWAMALLRLHARASVWLLRVIVGTRLEIRGLDKLPDTPCLIAAKHQSTWDTFALIPIFRDPALIMKAELALIPLYGWFSYKFGHIFVKRQRKARALKQMIRDAKSRAAHNRDILIFPEGTRKRPGAAPDYKSGIVALYEGLDLPCVPVALNSGLFWPRRRLRRYPGTIIVEILDPIPPGLPRAEFRDLLRNRIETASTALITEAAAMPDAPPLARAAKPMG